MILFSAQLVYSTLVPQNLRGRPRQLARMQYHRSHSKGLQKFMEERKGRECAVGPTFSGSFNPNWSHCLLQFGNLLFIATSGHFRGGSNQTKTQSEDGIMIATLFFNPCMHIHIFGVEC